ncbi:ribosome silencing factor [Comamonas denitrificans]|uniref:Ribosomal silencing factor RsfS n=1 Tax=Comamonas denitrificans TaxID=117506 RepID=A0A939H042_9BURK|nr:ribosome silencing factor [Comamonas denitrificans]MBO1249176.1 ribosome silencing factor [Comamonas denitrificans]
MSSTSNTAVKKDLTKLQRAIIDGLEDVKAQDIQVFDTEHLSPLFERVIVATGTSNRQTKAIASSVRDAVKKAGFATPRHEGEASGEWIIVDCNQAVVHIMQPAIRQYYRLEEIWGEKPVRVKLGGAKVSKRTASEDASQEAPAATPAKKPSVRKTASTTAAEPKASTTKPRAASTRSASSATTSASAAKKAPAKKPMTTTKVAGGAAAAVKKAPARKPAAPKAEAAIKTVVVKPTTARGAAKKPGAVRKAAAAKKV